jgi:uncharacterized membrane protein (DUF485 family)
MVWIETLRRKDLYVLIILLVAFLLALMALNIFGIRSMVGYIKEIGLLMAWVFAWILTIWVSARQLPQEERTGTIFPLLAKPVTRLQLIIGKWLGAWGIAGVSSLVFYILLIGIVIARGGNFNLALTVEAWILHFCFMAVVAAMGILFSTRMNSDSAVTLTAIISFAAFTLLPKAPELAADAGHWDKGSLMFIYYALPHLELFDLRQRLVHNWETMPLEPFIMICAYGLLMTAVFLLLGWLAYRRKMFNRDVL